MKQKPLHPRNPLVPLMRQRSGGGIHQKSRKTERQAAKRQLRHDKGEAGFAYSAHTAL